MAIAIRAKVEPWADPSREPLIRIEGLSKSFDQEIALNEVSLEIYKGEFFSLLGSSGCGKTTLLRLIAGLERADSGRVIIDGQDVTDLAPYKRPVNTVFQSYALFPHMTVADNVAFGLKQDGIAKSEIGDRVAEMLELVQLGNFAKRKPDQLSGGQRQRVALARGLVKRPKVLLLDEPLGALDKKLRERTQFELVNLQEKIGTTFIMVTHDQEEAMTVSSRVGLMDKGRLEQIGTPIEIYEYPATRYAAEFIGTANIFDGALISLQDSGEALVQVPELGLETRVAKAGGVALGQPIGVMVRPEKISVSKSKPADNLNQVQGSVTEIGYLGDMSIYHVRLDNGYVVQASQLNSHPLAEREIDWEDKVWLSWHPSNAIVVAQ